MLIVTTGWHCCICLKTFQLGSRLALTNHYGHHPVLRYTPIAHLGHRPVPIPLMHAFYQALVHLMQVVRILSMKGQVADQS